MIALMKKKYHLLIINEVKVHVINQDKSLVYKIKYNLITNENKLDGGETGSKVTFSNHSVSF